MRIQSLQSTLLRIPLAIPLTASMDAERGSIRTLDVLWLHAETDSGCIGNGAAVLEGIGGRALLALANECAPLLSGAEVWQSDRNLARLKLQVGAMAHGTIWNSFAAALDLLHWDLKGKDTNKPVHQLLGDARDSLPAFAGDIGWRWRSADEIMTDHADSVRASLQGFTVEIGDPNPQVDAERLTRIRDAIGEDAWLGVTATSRYDHAMALYVGRFLDEDIAPDWYEDPLPHEDHSGYERLAKRLETPIAGGQQLCRLQDFKLHLQREAIDILRPNPQLLGGWSETRLVLAMAEAHNRSAVLSGPQQLTVHLACSNPSVRMVEYNDWLQPILESTISIKSGMLYPPSLPGLGLTPKPDAIARFKVG